MEERRLYTESNSCRFVLTEWDALVLTHRWRADTWRRPPPQWRRCQAGWLTRTDAPRMDSGSDLAQTERACAEMLWLLSQDSKFRWSAVTWSIFHSARFDALKQTELTITFLDGFHFSGVLRESVRLHSFKMTLTCFHVLILSQLWLTATQSCSWWNA